MKRIQSFEFNDIGRVPEYIRESTAEVLGRSLRLSRIYEAAAPAFQEFCERSGATAILDLCSGSGEPVSILLDALRGEDFPVPRFKISDLHPNLPSMNIVARRHPRRISVIEKSLDATNVNDEYNEPARTIISAFHHFRPEMAVKILKDCVRNESSVFILEPMTRSLPRALKLGIFYGVNIFGNPFMAPEHRPEKMKYTFLLPVIPGACVWDAMVSVFRIYDGDELHEMSRSFKNNYQWEYREISIPLGGRISVFMGFPASIKKE